MNLVNKSNEAWSSKFDSQATIKKLQYANSEFKLKETNKESNISSNRLQLNDYYDYCSKLFNSKIQNQQASNDLLACQLNFDSVLMLKSLVLQDLFSGAFKRYLECSKHNIEQNLANRLSQPIQQNIILQQSDVLGRHSYPKRKNTDVMSNETIETDLNNHFGCQNKERSPIIINKTLPLSSFIPVTKARCNSLLTNMSKSQSLDGGHLNSQNQ